MIEKDFKTGKFVCRTICSSLTDRVEKKEEKKYVSGPPVILLHGYAFTSAVWNEINVLKSLTENNIPYVAVDMPYGKKSNCSHHTSDIESNLSIVRKIAVKFEKPPVLVGASLGGNIALRYSTKYPVSGLLLIAPARSLKADLTGKYDGSIFPPVKIIYGTKDSLIPKKEMLVLSNLLDAEIEFYEGAKHPAYLEFPDRFKKDLLELYNQVASTSEV